MRIYLTKWDYYDIFVQVRHLSYYVNFTRLAKLQRLKAFKPFKFPLSRDFWVTWLLQQTSDLTRDYRQRLRGDKNRTSSRLAVKASIFTNAFAAGKRKKRNATRESLSKRREREKTCLSMLSCAGRYREIETVTRIACSSDLIIVSLISSIISSSSLLSAVSRSIVQLVSPMLHLSSVSSHFPYSSPNTIIVTSSIASHYFVAANRGNVSLIMFKVSFLFTVPCNFPGWWVETREKLLNGLT